MSHTTVSRALRGSALVQDETRERIQRLALALGYQPNLQARSLVIGQSYTIAVCSPDMDNPHFADLCRQFRDAMAEHGYDAVFSTGRSDRALAMLLGRRYDGAAFVYGFAPGDPIRADIVLPVVTIGFVREGFDGVAIDRRSGVMAAIAHLCEMGHRRIGYAGVRGETAAPHAEKEAAFFEAIARYGLQVLPQWEGAEVRNRADGFEFAAHLAGLPAAERPSAVYCQNDITALGLINGLWERGVKVPDEISVLGMDDIPESAFAHPPLSTIRQPRAELARLGAQLLLERMANGTEAPVRHHLVRGELVARRSVARLSS